ncbi:MAG: right-handed parallel beta-helix repeat-containing protein [Pirellulaceae bacterium]|nr:right-handed parallel beta-helix repeat-containing protein [Pirellulaceae bacterium]
MIVLSWFGSTSRGAESVGVSVADYPSVQAAVEANAGQAVYVPAGDYLLSEEVSISSDGTELYGPGRLIQQNPRAAIVRIHDAKHVTLRGLTLTRAAGFEEAEREGVRVDHTEYAVLDNLQVLDNRAKDGAITMTDSQHCEIRYCFIHNYSRITVDDRTQYNESKYYGYAFNCIDGTGISVSNCQDVLIQSNRVIEENLQATPEVKDDFQLGTFVRRNEQRGELVSEQTWQVGYVNNWHQGSAITVSSPERTRYVRLVNNHIENAAQGIDIHADHVLVQGNMVIDSFIGMKAMHGSRYVLIANNHFSRSVLWAIGLMPGASSKIGNEDGDSIITGNIISEFGYGKAAWIWPSDEYTCVPIKLERGQTAENPPLRNVLISSNVVAESYSDDLAAGSQRLSPRYKWALLIDTGPGGPLNVTISDDNLFPPGTEGVRNR